MCRFGLLAVLGSLATMLGMWFSNVVLVSQPGGYAALGVFNAAERWRQLLLFLPASLAPIILSMLSHLHGKNDPAGYRRLIALNLWVSLAAILVPAVVVVLFAPLAMSVFSPPYSSTCSGVRSLAGTPGRKPLPTYFSPFIMSSES